MPLGTPGPVTRFSMRLAAAPTGRTGQDRAMTSSYRLLDAGGRARLERFGDRIVDRPSPAATEPPRDPDAWASADLVFDGADWSAHDGRGVEPWTVGLEGFRLELRPTAAGQVGLFPEQLAGLDWLRTRVTERLAADPAGAAPRVLNLFAHTGLATLALAAAGAAVAHVDAARASVEWARRNAAASNLADRPVRWLVDDALTFVAREARRGRRYAGLVLDPPSYGHGTGGRRWQLARALPDLLNACDAILEPTAFGLLTAHTPDFDAERLAAELARALGAPPAWVEAGDLELRATSGARLPLGAFARIMGR
jgi:23S rRNA (cytosine1962-C5)-methyltransferase